MEAASKRVRGSGGSSGDRLSALTDDLLGRILSFLPSRQSVQTSVLSKRWTDLWRSVPAINLDVQDFRVRDDDHYQRWLKMEDFTTNLLMRHRVARLDAFRLHIIGFYEVESRDFHRWIRRAIEYRPSVLEVKLPDCSSEYQLPNLRACRLKVLHLHGVSLDHAFADHLRSECPVLQELVTSWCYNDFGSIQSDSLKKLTVDGCASTSADMLVIRAPYLASLRLNLYFHTYKNGISLDTGNSLVEASISVLHCHYPPVNEAVLLGSVFSVTSLETRGFSAMAMLDKELDKFPTFDNLTALFLRRCLTDNCAVHKFNALGRFLQRCPNLKKLTLMDFGVVPFVGPVQFPTLENLRTLILDGCNLNDNFQLLRRCLRSSPDLEKLTIQLCWLPEVCSGRKGKTKSKKEYSSFQIRSLTCFQCQKLKSTEIRYRQGDKIQELVSFSLDVSGHAPQNTIMLTKV